MMLRSRAVSGWRWVAGWVGSAPGTYIWLLILTVTALQLQQLPPRVRHTLLVVDSTNIVQLNHHPVRVLLLSALWTQEGSVLPYLVLFSVFHAPVERWLGTARWLVVVASAHVLATLISEGILAMLISSGQFPQRMSYTLDVGVSYGLAGVAGVLTYRLAGRWSLVYVACAVGFLGYRLVTGQTFTDIGHFAALLVGLACYPLVRNKPTWDPSEMIRRLRRQPNRFAKTT